MRSLLGALTTRGRSFVAAGVVAAACGLLIPEPDLLRIGALLIVLPLLSALGASRARYRLSCSRRVLPPRLPVGQQTELTIRLANVSRLRTGLLLAEDTLPYALGDRPRFVLDGIGAGGSMDLHYQIRPDTRGKYTVGPVQIRVADSFGLVAISRSFTTTSTLTVTPKIIALTRPPLAGNWLGDSEQSKRSIAASGEDDVAPRAYRTGDGLHRVHWRSTARHGELMVRREEQLWRNTASLFIDTRRAAHGTASFEFAVTAAASIGVHLAGQGFDARLVTDAGEIPAQGTFRDTLLDTLAIIRPSRETTLRAGIHALSSGGGQIIAVLGMLTVEQARELAAARQGTAPALALLLLPHAYGQNHDPAAAPSDVLASAGWRVATVREGESLIEAWQQLHRIGGPAASVTMPVPAPAGQEREG
jgi:uncharacterized protein (DUF58 family)